MTPYATVEEYEARYGTVTDTQTLQACLEDATALIASYLDAAGVDADSPDEELADRLMRVCRQVAHRSLDSGAASVPFGVSQASQTAGGYSLSYSFSNPNGDIFLTAAERRMLGLGGFRFRTIEARSESHAGRWWPC